MKGQKPTNSQTLTLCSKLSKCDTVSKYFPLLIIEKGSRAESSERRALAMVAVPMVSVKGCQGNKSSILCPWSSITQRVSEWETDSQQYDTSSHPEICPLRPSWHASTSCEEAPKTRNWNIPKTVYSKQQALRLQTWCWCTLNLPWWGFLREEHS